MFFLVIKSEDMSGDPDNENPKDCETPSSTHPFHKGTMRNLRWQLQKTEISAVSVIQEPTVITTEMSVY